MITAEDEQLVRTKELKETLMKNSNYRTYVVEKALKECKLHLSKSDLVS